MTPEDVAAIERAERAEAAYDAEHAAANRMAAARARIRDLLPETCGAPYCGPCHDAIRKIRAAIDGPCTCSRYDGECQCP